MFNDEPWYGVRVNVACFIFLLKNKMIPIPETLWPELIFCEPFVRKEKTLLSTRTYILRTQSTTTTTATTTITDGQLLHPLTFVSLIRCSGQFDPHTDRHIHRHTNRHIRCGDLRWLLFNSHSFVQLHPNPNPNLTYPNLSSHLASELKPSP